MTVLESIIRAELTAQGPMPLARYIELCLYHPQHGYYTTGRNFLTSPPADFTTAPELTPLFAQALAIWLERQWDAAGRPSAFTLLEAGPGRGLLMRDVLTFLSIHHPACYAACAPLLVETSPALRAIQQATLAEFPQSQWLAHWPTTAYASPAVFVLANELLDAFPTDQKNAAGELATVEINAAGALVFKQPPGLLVEHSPAQTAWLLGLQATPNLRAALLVDYGYLQVAPGASVDTVQAVHVHQFVELTHRPGETDITTHVDFTHVARVLGPHACTTHTLQNFLLNHRIARLALTEKTPDSVLHRLLHPTAMGGLFKVLEYHPHPGP